MTDADRRLFSRRYPPAARDVSDRYSPVRNGAELRSRGEMPD